MKLQEPYFVATENAQFELEAIHWCKNMLDAVTEAERRKTLYPDETVIIAKTMKIYSVKVECASLDKTEAIIENLKKQEFTEL